MRYEVRMSDRAWAAVLRQGEYIAREGNSPQNSGLFLARVMDAIDELSFMPRRCGRALEATGGVEVRAMPVDGFLLLFIVEDDARLVRIIAARHGRQSPLADLGGEI